MLEDGAGDQAAAGELGGRDVAKGKGTSVLVIVIEEREGGDVERVRDIMGCEIFGEWCKELGGSLNGGPWRGEWTDREAGGGDDSEPCGAGID